MFNIHKLIAPNAAKTGAKPYRAPRFTAVNTADKDKLTKPARAHDGDAGYDLTLAATKPVVLAPGARATVPTGWAVRLDPATCGLILPRSGNASKLGLNVLTGVVDSGYTGELKVTVHNTSRTKITLTPGMRVAQLVVTPVVAHGAPAKTTKRAAQGFGSTDSLPSSEKAAGDMVNHPNHYTAHPAFTGECHDYTKYMTFDQGNAAKYLWRCAAKGDMEENIRKAIWYLEAMKHGPVVGRYGNALNRNTIHKLDEELAAALDRCNKDTAPARYMAALAAYSAFVYIAAGDTNEALMMTRHALQRLAS